MEIGDGLTFQSRTINGKSMPGIYLLPNNDQKFASQKVKTKPKPQNFVASNKKQANTTSNNRNNVNYQRKKVQETVEERKKIVTRVSNNRNREKAEKSDNDDIVFINDKVKMESNETNKTTATSKESFSKAKNVKKSSNSNNSNSKRKSATKSEVDQGHVDTKYVTLTQDQLTTILSLVKTKQDIDLAEVINKDKKSKDRKKSGDSRSSNRSTKHTEPASVPGLDLSDDERDTQGSSNEKKEENIGNLLKKSEKTKKNKSGENSDAEANEESAESKPNDDSVSSSRKKENLSGTLGGFGTRDRDKSQIERRRKQWIQDLNEQLEHKKKLENVRKESNQQIKSAAIGPSFSSNKSDKKSEHNSSAPTSANSQNRTVDKKEDQSKSYRNVENIHGNLPTAIRSSFFLGEAAPRDHAFSAKKRQDQKRWKEELDKQMLENKKDQDKKDLEKKEPQDDAVWARHFDTMQAPSKLNRSLSPSNFQVPPNIQHSSPRNITSTLLDDSPLKHATSEQDMLGDPGNNMGRNDAAPNNGSYLRTMTSLLDPAQIEAIELRRMKQNEHRRAIEEQVQEKKRAKEEVERERKREEEMEERKLKEERENLQKQFDHEKNKQNAMEEMREQQTRLLYNQMKEAKASAMKEKFEKRQQHLRNKGHDTSRLEQTHKHTLETNTSMQVNRLSPDRSHVVPPIDFSELHSTSKQHYNVEPSIKLSPVNVLSNPSQNSIKLEISLNQSQLRNALVETAVQTERDEGSGMFSNILSDSDNDTEYLPLPHPSGRRPDMKKSKHHKNKEQRNKSHYDRYSRTSPSGGNETSEVEVRSQKTKPKWGAGNKKKTFVPASKRYVNAAQWKERHDLNRQRREEKMLNQQALNDPDRLMSMRRRNDIEKGRSPTPPIPILQHHLHDPNNVRRNRSISPPKKKEFATAKNKKYQRSHSPPVPAVRNRLIGSPEGHREHHRYGHNDIRDRSDTSMSVTTDHAKFNSHKHTSTSPVPDTIEYVEYTRSEDVLNPNQPASRSNTEVRFNNNQSNNYQNHQHFQQTTTQEHVKKPTADPLLNADVVKQHDRQDRILREISILRQGLLLKQREVASYPTNFNHGGRNLPERTNDNVV